MCAVCRASAGLRMGHARTSKERPVGVGGPLSEEERKISLATALALSGLSSLAFRFVLGQLPRLPLFHSCAPFDCAVIPTLAMDIRAAPCDSSPFPCHRSHCAPSPNAGSAHLLVVLLSRCPLHHRPYRRSSAHPPWSLSLLP